MIEKAVNNQDQDHQKGKDTREVSHALSKVHLTMMLKNAVNDRVKLTVVKRESLVFCGQVFAQITETYIIILSPL